MAEGVCANKDNYSKSGNSMSFIFYFTKSQSHLSTDSMVLLCLHDNVTWSWHLLGDRLKRVEVIYPFMETNSIRSNRNQMQFPKVNDPSIFISQLQWHLFDVLRFRGDQIKQTYEWLCSCLARSIAHHPNLYNNIFPLRPNLILYHSHRRMHIYRPSYVTMTKLEYLNPLIDIFIQCTSAGLTPFLVAFFVFNVQTHPLHKSTI